jgi:hypothetical protein
MQYAWLWRLFKGSISCLDSRIFETLTINVEWFVFLVRIVENSTFQHDYHFLTFRTFEDVPGSHFLFAHRQTHKSNLRKIHVLLPVSEHYLLSWGTTQEKEWDQIDFVRNTPSAKLLRVAIMGIHRIGQETILFSSSCEDCNCSYVLTSNNTSLFWIRLFDVFSCFLPLPTWTRNTGCIVIQKILIQQLFTTVNTL